MRCIENGKLSFVGKTEPCWNCSPTSYRPVPSHECSICNGAKQLDTDFCSNVSKEDRQTLCDMIDFATPYDGASSGFNEGYLGLGILAGVTDYGRYRDMTEDAFQAEVKRHVMEYHLQYATFAKKDKANPGQFIIPKKFTVRKGQGGWFVYPQY